MSSDNVDTYGWDTAFGITFKNANLAIKNGKSSPTAFSAAYHDPLDSRDYTIAGSFGDWQLSGGSGSLVHMALPVSGGTVVPQGSGTPQRFAGTATIEVKLAFIPQPQVNDDSGKRKALKVATVAATTDSAAAVLNFTFDQGSQFTDGVAVKEALGAWLNQHLAEFNHVFSVLDVNAQADKEQLQWLKPTEVNYAVYAPSGATVDDYVFGVLAMTERRSAARLSSEIDPNIIPTDANAGFLIAAERVVDKILLPYIYLLFENASAADFTTRDDGLTVTNIKGLDFQKFSIGENDDKRDINDATIDAGNFTMDVFSTTVRMQFTNMQFTWKEGFIVHLNYTGLSDFTTDEKGHLQMTPLGQPSVDVTVTKTEAEEWITILEDIGIGIGSAVVAALIGGALGAAADAAAEAAQASADEALQAASNEVEMTTFKINGIPVSELDDAVLESEDGLGASDVTQTSNTSYRTAFKGWFIRNWRKLVGFTIGTILGTTVGEISVYLIESANKGGDNDKLPTIHPFVDESVSSTTWPNTSGYDLASVKLNGALQIGLNLHIVGT